MTFNILLKDLAKGLGVSVEFLKDLKKRHNIKYTALKPGDGIEIEARELMHLMAYVAFRDTFQPFVVEKLLTLAKARTL